MKNINDINLPSLDEMDEMTLDQLKEWRNILHPFYIQRSKILERQGSKAYKKALYLNWFQTMIENVENGIDRWHRVTNYKRK